MAPLRTAPSADPVDAPPAPVWPVSSQGASAMLTATVPMLVAVVVTSGAAEANVAFLKLGRVSGSSGVVIVPPTGPGVLRGAVLRGAVVKVAVLRAGVPKVAPATAAPAAAMPGRPSRVVAGLSGLGPSAAPPASGPTAAMPPASGMANGGRPLGQRRCVQFGPGPPGWAGVMVAAQSVRALAVPAWLVPAWPVPAMPVPVWGPKSGVRLRILRQPPPPI